MYAIFQAECKKALSRKNLFVTILYTGILLIFILINARTFTEVREIELQRLQRMAVNAERNAEARRHEADFFRDTRRYQAYEATRTLMHTHYTRLYQSENIRLMVAAMEENDRAAEITFFNNIRLAHLENYRYAYALRGRYGPGSWIARRGPNTRIEYPVQIEHHQAHQAFTQHFVDNNILYIYESEMRGLNFAYQVLRQVLPLIMLFIVFVGVSDVFTSDNQWGSYKFLLVNPISRAKVFAAKLISACFIAFMMVFGPVAVIGVIMGAVNGFGPANYPILTQSGAFASFTALPNNLAHDRILGNFVGQWIWLTAPGIDFANTGTAYLLEHPALGLTAISSHVPSPNYPFAPHPDLRYTSMLQVLFMALPVYLLLILAAAAASALISVIFQRGIPTVIFGVLLSLGVIFFPAPDSNISVLARLNPYMYTNPINILNGLGSTTALTGIVVLAGWSVVFITAGLLLFRKRDIRC